MSHYAEFDRVIVNDDFETAVEQLLEILRGSPGYRADRPELAAPARRAAGLKPAWRVRDAARGSGRCKSRQNHAFFQ